METLFDTYRSTAQKLTPTMNYLIVLESNDENSLFLRSLLQTRRIGKHCYYKITDLYYNNDINWLFHFSIAEGSSFQTAMLKNSQFRKQWWKKKIIILESNDECSHYRKRCWRLVGFETNFQDCLSLNTCVGCEPNFVSKHPIMWTACFLITRLWLGQGLAITHEGPPFIFSTREQNTVDDGLLPLNHL